VVAHLRDDGVGLATVIGQYHTRAMLPYTLHGTWSATLRLVNSRTIRLSKRKKWITRN
jgi:hypothetical protein